LTKRCSEQRNWSLRADMNTFNCSHLGVIGSLTEFNCQNKKMFVCLLCMQRQYIGDIGRDIRHWESNHIDAVLSHSWTWTRSFNTSLTSVNLSSSFRQLAGDSVHLNSVSWQCAMSFSWFHSIWSSFKSIGNALMIELGFWCERQSQSRASLQSNITRLSELMRMCSGRLFVHRCSVQIEQHSIFKEQNGSKIENIQCTRERGQWQSDDTSLCQILVNDTYWPLLSLLTSEDVRAILPMLILDEANCDLWNESNMDDVNLTTVIGNTKSGIDLRLGKCTTSEERNGYIVDHWWWQWILR
jgi:hypothetical protein